MTRLVQLYATTLRDGSQGKGVAFSMEDKVRIAHRLDAMGIHYIEGGWPGSNPKDLRFFARMQDVTLKHAKLAASSLTRRAGGTAESDSHGAQALGTALEENLAMVRDTIAFLRPKMDEVLFDAEHFFDGFRANRDY